MSIVSEASGPVDARLLPEIIFDESKATGMRGATFNAGQGCLPKRIRSLPRRRTMRVDYQTSAAEHHKAAVELQENLRSREEELTNLHSEHDALK